MLRKRVEFVGTNDTSCEESELSSSMVFVLRSISCVAESPIDKDARNSNRDLISMAVISTGSLSLLTWSNPAAAASSEYQKLNPVYEVGELFKLGIQLSYLLLLLGLLGFGTFFVIRQVLVRGEIDLSAKELQLETAVKIQPGYVTARNNLGDAYEKKKEYKSALNAFEEALLFDPNNKIARPRRDALKDKVQLYKGVLVVCFLIWNDGCGIRDNKYENGDSGLPSSVTEDIYVERSLLFLYTFQRKSEEAARRTLFFPNPPNPKLLSKFS
ncbi:hypothetical protein LXL04_028161 [Taraxacum kok-saghyz]